MDQYLTYLDNKKKNKKKQSNQQSKKTEIEDDDDDFDEKKEDDEEEGEKSEDKSESEDSDKEKYLEIGKKHICPYKLDTEGNSTTCTAPYDGFPFRQNLLRHLKQQHPEHEVNTEHKKISYTNRHASYVNGALKKIKTLLMAASEDTLKQIAPKIDQQLLLDYQSLVEPEEQLEETEKGMTKKDIKEAEKIRYVFSTNIFLYLLTHLRILMQGDLEESFGKHSRYFEANFFHTHQEEWETNYQENYLPFNEQLEEQDKEQEETNADEDELVDKSTTISVSSPSVFTTYAGLVIDDSSYDEEIPPSEEEFIKLQQKLIDNGTVPAPPPSTSTNLLQLTFSPQNNNEEAEEAEEDEEPALKKRKTKK